MGNVCVHFGFVCSLQLASALAIVLFYLRRCTYSMRKKFSMEGLNKNQGRAGPPSCIAELLSKANSEWCMH